MSDVRKANELRAKSVGADFINRSIARLLALTATILTLGLLSGQSPMTPAQAATLCAATYAESGAADDTQYAFGQTGQLTGSGFAPLCDVTVRITRPDGQVEVGTVTTDAIGSFAFSYPLATLAGDYVVTFLGQGGTALMAISFSNGPVVMLDRGDVRDGETVRISGTAYAPLSTVIVRVIRPDNSIVTSDGSPGSDSVAVDSIGDFAYDYVVRDGVMADYLVDVLDPQGNVLAATSFTDSAAFVKNIGSASTSGSGTSVGFTLPAGVSVAAGNSVIIGVSWANTASPVTCTDSASNAYAIDVTAARPINMGSISILSAHNVSTLGAGDTISCTIPGASGTARTMSANEFSGLVTTLTLDQTHADNGSSNTPTSGATVTTSQSDELLFGAVFFNGPSGNFTAGNLANGCPSASYTLTNPVVSAGNQARLATEYAIATTPGTYAACGARNQSSPWAAAIATYKISTVKDTTTTVSSSSNPSAYGDPVTFAASVAAGATPVTAGSVSFIEGGTCASPGTTLGGPTALNGSGQATFSTSALAYGSHTIVACYGGAAGFNPSNGSVTQSISTRSITVTADAQSKTYGDADPSPLTYKITSGSLASGDSFSGALTRAPGENAGTYTILKGTLALNSNYSLSYVGANLTIKQKDATWTTNAASKTYGDADPTPLTTGSGSGFLPADNVSATYSRVAGENASPPTYHITATLSATVAGALNNYNTTNAGAAFSINPRPITVMADPMTKVYGNYDPALTYHISSGSLVGTDSFSGGLTRVAGENVGTYAIASTLSLGSNYSLTYVGASFTITPRPITVTADAKAKFVGNPDPMLIYSITNGSLAFSDSFAGALTRDSGETVGTYAIRQGTLALNSNYALTFVEGNFYIISITVNGPAGPLSKGSPATVTGSFPNTGTQAGPICKFDWDDTTTTDYVAAMSINGVWTCSASRTYTGAGVYEVRVAVNDAITCPRTDPPTCIATGSFQYVVIYDASAGFVTGGGWINSPAGAYPANPQLTGKANFGFVSKYKQGQSVPTGETEFQFNAASFNFHSTVYDWLVIAGSKAQYKGSGTVNGVGDYGFLLTATDGKINNGGGIDKFRIKVWNKTTSAIVYDNNIGASDDIDSANPQALGGGSITIHK